MTWTSLVCVLGLVACSSKPAEECGPGSAAGSGSAQLVLREIPPDVTRVQNAVGATLGNVTGVGNTTVTAVPAGIVVEGTTVVPLVNGTVDPAEKEGGPLGIVIPRLYVMLQQLEQEQQVVQQHDRAPVAALPVQIAIDPRLTYVVLHEIVASVQRARGTSELLVRSGADLGALPVAVATEGDSRSLVVRVSADNVVISFGGRPDHRLALDRSTPVSVANELSRIPSGALGVSVVVECAGATSMQTVAELLVAMQPHTTHILLARID